MADAIKFPGSNFVFSAPPGREDVSDLHTFRQPDGPCNVSCWRLRPEELDEVIRSGGLVFHSVMSGLSYYPAFLGAESVVRSVVVDYGKVWDRGPTAPRSAASLARSIFAESFHPDEDPAVIEQKWQEWETDRRRARRQAACARAYMMSPEAIDRAIAAMTPHVSEDMDESMRRAWLTDLARTAIEAAMATGEAA